MKGTIMSVSLSIFMIITDARYEGQWLFFAYATAIDPHNRPVSAKYWIYPTILWKKLWGPLTFPCSGWAGKGRGP